ncbi:MAG TPA: type IV pilus modification protein PilV [Rhodoferax sp.]|nr:type IV pilus modification protein PilV [Rhodoferax sp.]
MLTQPDPTKNSRGARSREAGASLLEILITILLISFGLLGLAGMQAYSVANNSSSVNRATAIAMASDFADLVRANAAGFAAGGYDRGSNFDKNARTVTALTAGDICAFPTCTTATLSAYELRMTQVRLKAALPAGDFALVRVVSGGVTSTTQADLWIMWVEQKLNTDVDVGGESTEKVYDNCPANVRGMDPLPRCFYMRVSL